MFVMDLLLLALHPVILPNPGVERIFIHPEVTGSLCNGLIRFDGHFHRTFLEFGGIFVHRQLTHRTHLVCCVSSLSPCVRKSIATSSLDGYHAQQRALALCARSPLSWRAVHDATRAISRRPAGRTGARYAWSERHPCVADVGGGAVW